MASKIPKFMSHYSNSFAKSQILERIIPREICSPTEL
jgi:geranylgeranyl diphosphate synthase type 3